MLNLFRPFLRWFSLSEEPGLSSSRVLLWLVRGIFGAILIGLAIKAFYHFMTPEESPHGDTFKSWTAFLVILGSGLFIVMLDVWVRNKQITTISAIYFGMLLGLLLGQILSYALDPFLSERNRQGQ